MSGLSQDPRSNETADSRIAGDDRPRSDSEGSMEKTHNEKDIAEAPVAGGSAPEATPQDGPKPSFNDTSAIPDGGVRAWLQVAGSFFLFLNTWGLLNTFGAYQTYYETGELYVSTASNIAWIGSIQAFLVLFVGALTGPLYDRGYAIQLLWVGSFLIVFGQMMLSLCHEYWQALLAQGFCIGMGAGCLFVPTVGIISQYFAKKIAFAIGIAATGSSIGGIIYPIAFHRLVGEVGFGWATRILGFIMLATQAVPLIVMRMRVLPPRPRKLFDLSAFKEPLYDLWILGALIAFMALYIPFFFIQYYCIQNGIVDNSLAFYLLAIINTTSTFGRVIPNYFGDKLGPINVIMPCALISGLLTLCLIAIHSKAGIIIFCILYGFFTGAFVSLPPAVFVSVTENRALIGTRMGQGFAFISVGLLLGAPIGGAILRADGYSSTWAFGGAMSIGGGAIMAAARLVKTKGKIMAKA